MELEGEKKAESGDFSFRECGRCSKGFHPLLRPHAEKCGTANTSVLEGTPRGGSLRSSLYRKGNPRVEKCNGFPEGQLKGDRALEVQDPVYPVSNCLCLK